MATAGVTVMGAGVAGLASALHLARAGHTVTVLERDPVAVGEPGSAPDWPRRGLPQFRQPHAFIPRGVAELRDRLPDVHADLLAAGAMEADLRRKLPGPAAAGDELLRYLAVRRPLVEWALRRAVEREPAVTVRWGVRVEGLATSGGRVTSIRVDGSDLPVDVLVDALGRRTPVPGWLTEAGVPVEPLDTSDCAVVYYSRYYRVRSGCDLPDGPWLLSPRGDLGYLGFATFPGDNGTFAALLLAPSGAPEWHALAAAPAFDAAVAQIPQLRAWVDPEAVDPITEVMAMAGLRNGIRPGDQAPGLVVPVGDARCHTDPSFAYGMAFALIHAGELTSALGAHAHLGDAIGAYVAATAPALRERYDVATRLDDERHRLWLGEPLDPGRPDGAYGLFSLLAAGAVAMVDPDVFRVFVRRIGLLDSTAVLDGDPALQQRIAARFAELRAVPRPPAGPPRAEMLDLLAAATR